MGPTDSSTPQPTDGAGCGVLLFNGKEFRQTQRAANAQPVGSAVSAGAPGHSPARCECPVDRPGGRRGTCRRRRPRAQARCGADAHEARERARRAGPEPPSRAGESAPSGARARRLHHVNSHRIPRRPRGCAGSDCRGRYGPPRTAGRRGDPSTRTDLSPQPDTTTHHDPLRATRPYLGRARVVPGNRRRTYTMRVKTLERDGSRKVLLVYPTTLDE